MWRAGRPRPSSPPADSPRWRPRSLSLLDVWPAEPYRAQGTRKIRIVIPEVFSFISNPDETVRTLKQIRRFLGLKSLEEVFFDHSRCRKLDLCASLVRDVLVLRAKRQAKNQHRRIVVSGNWSGEPSVDVLLISSGILKHLQHPIADDLPKELSERLRVSKLRTGRPSSPEFTSEGELASSRVLKK
jgi:hypothetical protein